VEALTAKAPAVTRARKTADLPADVDEPLLARLKVLRKQLADRDQVPAYIVFSDKTLIEMAQLRPRTAAQLLDVSGVGASKLARYGDAFLAVITAQ
jgi:ATP-dependent DNA helicase RecQ